MAYKNAVGMRRIAWRAAKAAHKIPKYSKQSGYEPAMRAYVKKLEEELVNLCKDMLNLITKHLIPKARRAESAESEVFYLKLQGDYFRYVAEVGEGDRLEKATERALDSYNKALEKVEESGMNAADPTKLGLLLNFSVFCHETIDQKDQALEMATGAYEEALAEINSLDKGKAQEAATILDFIRENINQWNKKEAPPHHKKNMFSQQDSEAQFINQDDDEDDDEYGEAEY